MRINDLVEALQPLAGWRVHAVSEKYNDTFPCYAVRRLEQRERETRANVILASTEEPTFDRQPGLTLLAKDITRVDWCDNRAWLENRGNHTGYIQQTERIEEDVE